MLFLKRINKPLRYSLIVVILISWQQAQGCELSENQFGRTVYKDCFLFKDQPQLKKPNLHIKSASISVAAGGGTGLGMSFEVSNNGQLDTDSSLFQLIHSFVPNNGEFDIETVAYVMSEDLMNNFHFDERLYQYVPLSHDKQRSAKLAAHASRQISLSPDFAPRFFLRDREQTYKVGLVIKVDEEISLSGSSGHGISGRVDHGEIIESDEFDNSYSTECLVYANTLTDLSEILHITHFHVNSDLNLPLISPC